MFGSDPFAGTITERPIGITLGRRLVVASQPRVESAREAARRVVADHEAHVEAETASASAWSSACSTTAPQNDQE